MEWFSKKWKDHKVDRVEEKRDDANLSVSLAKERIEKVRREGGFFFRPYDAENIIAKASELFEEGKYERAKELAEESKRRAEDECEVYLQKRATVAVQKARDAINFGCDVNTEELLNKIIYAEELLNKVIFKKDSALERCSLIKKAERLAKEVQEVIKEMKAESKPEMKIVHRSMDRFQPSSWQNVEFEISNVGKAHAKDIQIHFSEEVKIKDLREVFTLNRGESKILKFMLKPLDTGEVPVDVTVNFRDFDRTSYTDVKRFYLDVIPEVPEVKVTIRDWEFIKEIIEEVTQARVEVKELRQDLERRYSEKDLARILEASKIMEEMIGMSYQRTVRTDYFLDTLKSLEGYTEGLSKRITSEINKFRRFLKEELFEYVDDEHKRDVRRFCRNLLDIWIAEVLKEGE